MEKRWGPAAAPVRGPLKGERVAPSVIKSRRNQGRFVVHKNRSALGGVETAAKQFDNGRRALQGRRQASKKGTRRTFEEEKERMGEGQVQSLLGGQNGILLLRAVRNASHPVPTHRKAMVDAWDCTLHMPTLPRRSSDNSELDQFFDLTSDKDPYPRIDRSSVTRSRDVR